VFQELKLRKKHKYIIFGLSPDKTEIVKVKTGTSTDYDEFLADLPENECRWAIYDFEFQKEDGGQRNKIIFYHWYVLSPPHFDAPLSLHPPLSLYLSFVVGANGVDTHTRMHTQLYIFFRHRFHFVFPLLSMWNPGVSGLCRSPDGAKIKDKMVFASSRDALRRSLVGIAVEIQGTDDSEVAYETGAVFSLLLPLNYFILYFISPG
jgi:hypothetical protein